MKENTRKALPGQISCEQRYHLTTKEQFLNFAKVLQDGKELGAVTMLPLRMPYHRRRLFPSNGIGIDVEIVRQ